MFGLGIHYLNGWAMAAADGAKKRTRGMAASSGPNFHGDGGGMV